MSQPMTTGFSEARSDKSDSTTVSEFVRTRYRGDVPVFGGNPYNGLNDIGAALRGTGQNVNNNFQVAAMNFAEAMQNMAAQANPTIYRRPVSQEPTSPIRMLDNDYGDLTPASQLSDDAITSLISASKVRTDDISRYLQLLMLARDGVKKKVAAQASHEMRKQAKTSFQPIVLPEEVEKELPANQDRLQAIKRICRIDLPPGRADVDLLMAITHDSYYGGREANRVLAYIGDAAARLYAASELRATGRAVSDVSHVVSHGQSNEVFRDKSVALELHNQVRVGLGVDPSAKNVIANCYEGIIAVVFIHLGFEGLNTLNETLEFYKPL